MVMRINENEHLDKINENLKEYFVNFENLPYGIAVVKNDADCTIIQANSAYYKLIGYTKEQLWERHQNRIVEILIDNVYDVIERHSMEQDFDIEFDLRFRTANGEIRWIHDFAHYNAELDVFFVTVTDITDKLLIQGDELSYDAFLAKHEILIYVARHTSDHVVVTDLITDEVVYMNPMAMKLLNFNHESDWLGKTYVDLFYGSPENVPEEYYQPLSTKHFTIASKFCSPQLQPITWQ